MNHSRTVPESSPERRPESHPNDSRSIPARLQNDSSPRARLRIREQGTREGSREHGARERGAGNSTPEVINARLNYAEHDFLGTAKLWLLTIIERCYLSPISSSTRLGGFDA